MRHTIWQRRTKIFFGLTLLFSAYLYFAGSVDKSLADEDKQLFQKLDLKELCVSHKDFDEEKTCVLNTIQYITSKIPDITCAQKGESIEPKAFFDREHGCCVSRARFLEKALSSYGFQTRRVSLYDKSRFGILAAFLPGVSSHASLEVKTSKGWMGVDPYMRFLLITKEGQVLSFRDIGGRLDDLAYDIRPRDFFENDLQVVYGLYSRHGMFLGVNLPAPEIHYGDFLYNFPFF